MIDEKRQLRYNTRMSESTDIQRRRAIEDRAIELGEERQRLERETDTNTEKIRHLLDEAIAAGIPIEQYARMTTISRQTLHRWRAKQS